MLNKICVDADYNIELVIWLQDPRTFDYTWDNSIYIHVNADNTANQRLVVSDGEISTTITVTPGAEQDYPISDLYWNMGGDSTVSCYKNGTLVETFTFTFPDIIDSVGMLNRDENDDYHFTMTGSSAAVEIIEEQVHQNTSEISEAKEDINYLYENKQNYIHVDLLPPSGDGDEGDLQFYGSTPARLYRRENGAWVKKDWIAYGQTNLDASPVEGDIFIENDGSYIRAIRQYINGVWIDYATGYGHLVNFLTSEQNTEVKYLDGANIWERTYIFSSGVSLAADTWVNVVQNAHLAQVINAKGWNENGDMIALIGRMNNGYAQVLNLRSTSQTLKTLTLQYTRGAGSYEFNENYQVGESYTLATVNKNDLLADALRSEVKKVKGSTYGSITAAAAVVENNIQDIINHLSSNENRGVGIGIIFYAGGSTNCIIHVLNFEPRSGTDIIANRQTSEGYEYCRIQNGYSGACLDAAVDWGGNLSYGAGGSFGFTQIGYQCTGGSDMQPELWATNLGIHFV